MHALALWKMGLRNIAGMVCLAKPHEEKCFRERET